MYRKLQENSIFDPKDVTHIQVHTHRFTYINAHHQYTHTSYICMVALVWTQTHTYIHTYSIHVYIHKSVNIHIHIRVPYLGERKRNPEL